MSRFVFSLITMALSAIPTIAGAGQPTPFATMTGHYEAIRQVLLHDTAKDAARHAQAIAGEAAILMEATDSAKTGVPVEREAECASLLPEIKKAAEALAAAADLATAREAFGELSKPMIRYREMVSGERPMLVYCPMTKKAWVQPQGEIGNPYFGQSMAGCGKVMSE